MECIEIGQDPQLGYGADRKIGGILLK